MIGSFSPWLQHLPIVLRHCYGMVPLKCLKLKPLGHFNDVLVTKPLTAFPNDVLVTKPLTACPNDVLVTKPLTACPNDVLVTKPLTVRP